jgi:energy-coupling factor transport system substrate-specific component
MGGAESGRMRKLFYIVGGSALYAAVNLMTEHLSFAGVQAVRPGIVVPLVCGVLFGPVVGFLVGFLGSTGSDLPTFGFYWNSSLGNGLVGLVSGSTPFLISRIRARFPSQWPTIGAALVTGTLAVVLGAGLAAMSDILIANLTPDTAISAEWIPLASWNLVWGLPLLVIVLSIWALARRRVAS